jgi:hypothetical protein
MKLVGSERLMLGEDLQAMRGENGACRGRALGSPKIDRSLRLVRFSFAVKRLT